MSQRRFNAYKIMWIFCLFDLPTNTKAERKRASDFRKFLLEDGFNMMQYSVYYRCCGSLEACKVHSLRVKKHLPQTGKVSILKFTDKQFGEIETFEGKFSVKKQENQYLQLEFF